MPYCARMASRSHGRCCSQEHVASCIEKVDSEWTPAESECRLPRRGPRNRSAQRVLCTTSLMTELSDIASSPSCVRATRTITGQSATPASAFRPGPAGRDACRSLLVVSPLKTRPFAYTHALPSHSVTDSISRPRSEPTVLRGRPRPQPGSFRRVLDRTVWKKNGDAPSLVVLHHDTLVRDSMRSRCLASCAPDAPNTTP